MRVKLRKHYPHINIAINLIGIRVYATIEYGVSLPLMRDIEARIKDIIPSGYSMEVSFDGGRASGEPYTFRTSGTVTLIGRHADEAAFYGLSTLNDYKDPNVRARPWLRHYHDYRLNRAYLMTYTPLFTIEDLLDGLTKAKPTGL